MERPTDGQIVVRDHALQLARFVDAANFGLSYALVVPYHEDNGTGVHISCGGALAQLGEDDQLAFLVMVGRNIRHSLPDNVRELRPAAAECEKQAMDAAVARLEQCEEALMAESYGEEDVDWPADLSGPYDGCVTCIAREVLDAAYPHLERLIRSG